MWMFRITIIFLRFFTKKVIPFLIYLSFWCYNVYLLIYIPGDPPEAYWRFVAAITVIPGIVWGMIDSALYILSLIIGW